MPFIGNVLNVWKDWCWSWNSNTLATWCEELTHWKSPWCWERLKAGGEGDNRGWDGWMASLTQWTWVWVNSGSLWWTGRPGILQSMGSQRIGLDWATELNWTERINTHNPFRVQMGMYTKPWASQQRESSYKPGKKSSCCPSRAWLSACMGGVVRVSEQGGAGILLRRKLSLGA